MNPLLNTAVRAARLAGDVILHNVDRLDRIKIDKKGKADYVSEVDRFAEEEIINTIQSAYPDHAILAEESGHQEGKEFTWIIDPLDGTTNFLHGYPQFAVSIAVKHDDHTAHSVIYAPLRNEMFTASRGVGAYLNDRRIRVSNTQRLEDSLLGTGFPYRFVQHVDIWLGSFREFLVRTSGVRRAGSAALDLAHVACGRFDGFWEMGLKPWDMAAGCLLIEEAGGLLSDFSGDQDHLEKGHLICGNTYLFSEIQDIVRRHTAGKI